jgi:methionine-S-sulfoxide reductase
MDTHNAQQDEQRRETAVFAGGCFWCMEPPFRQMPGVVSVEAGYTGGRIANPTYRQVCSGTTGHAEAVRIVYDPAAVTYPELLEVFWRNIDPTTPGRQFADIGSQYRTAIFVHNKRQRELAEESKELLRQSGKFHRPIVTQIVDAGPFYPAEEYHQEYYRKNPQHYQRYKTGSGRAGFIERTWGASRQKP